MVDPGEIARGSAWSWSRPFSSIEKGAKGGEPYTLSEKCLNAIQRMLRYISRGKIYGDTVPRRWDVATREWVQQHHPTLFETLKRAFPKPVTGSLLEGQVDLLSSHKSPIRKFLDQPHSLGDKEEKKLAAAYKKAQKSTQEEKTSASKQKEFAFVASCIIGRFQKAQETLQALQRSDIQPTPEALEDLHGLVSTLGNRDPSKLGEMLRVVRNRFSLPLKLPYHPQDILKLRDLYFVLEEMKSSSPEVARHVETVQESIKKTLRHGINYFESLPTPIPRELYCMYQDSDRKAPLTRREQLLQIKQWLESHPFVGELTREENYTLSKLYRDSAGDEWQGSLMSQATYQAACKELMEDVEEGLRQEDPPKRAALFHATGYFCNWNAGSNTGPENVLSILNSQLNVGGGGYGAGAYMSSIPESKYGTAAIGLPWSAVQLRGNVYYTPRVEGGAGRYWTITRNWPVATRHTTKKVAKVVSVLQDDERVASLKEELPKVKDPHLSALKARKVRTFNSAKIEALALEGGNPQVVLERKDSEGPYRYFPAEEPDATASMRSSVQEGEQ